MHGKLYAAQKESQSHHLGFEKPFNIFYTLFMIERHQNYQVYLLFMYWTRFLPYSSLIIYFSLTVFATSLSVFEVSMFKYLYIKYNAQDWAISSPIGQDHKVSVFSL